MLIISCTITGRTLPSALVFTSWLTNSSGFSSGLYEGKQKIRIPSACSASRCCTPASAGSVPRRANNVPPSTPKPGARVSATTTPAPLLRSTAQKATATAPGIRSQCCVLSWLLDAAPNAKPVVARDGGLAMPGTHTFQQTHPAANRTARHSEDPRRFRLRKTLQ